MTASPSAPVYSTVAAWSRASNRRRLAEELSRALAWGAAGVVLLLGAERIRALAEPRWLSLEAGSRASLVLWVATTTAAVVLLAIALRRYVRARVSPASLARRVDGDLATEDLLATALAVETGTVEGHLGLHEAVLTRARMRVHAIAPPIARYREPRSALVAVGLAAALGGLAPGLAGVLPDAARTPSASDDGLTAPDLPEPTLARLERHADRIEQLASRPGLRPEVKTQLEAAANELQALRRNPARSLAKLAKAEAALRKLEHQARAQGLHDPEALAATGADELAREMIGAMERDETDTAAAMAKALAARLEGAEESDLRDMASALEGGLASTPAAEDRSRAGDEPDVPPAQTPADADGDASATSAHDGGHAESDRRATWRNRAESLPERLRAGDSGTGRSELSRLADEMRRAAGRNSAERSLDRALEDVRKARSKQLSELNGEPGAQTAEPGAGESAGAPGEGETQPGELGEPGDGARGAPAGPPTGRPGPGGGDGSAAAGRASSLPQASLHAAEQVDTPSGGEPQGSVRLIRRFADGYRDVGQYEALRQHYSAIAEDAVRREEIPLSRRDYIRDYFEAVRGD